jgi:hypothetical protein
LDEANITNGTGHRTEEDIAPNFWKWMIVAVCVLGVLALVSAAIFYYTRGRKENRPPSGVPQTLLFPPPGQPAIEIVAGKSRISTAADRLLVQLKNFGMQLINGVIKRGSDALKPRNRP